MDNLVLFVMGTFASFVLMHSLVVDKDQEGPFYIYNWVRSVVQSKRMPELVYRNWDCPVCSSFWTSFFVAVVIQFFNPFISVVHTLASLFILTYAMHGVIIFWFRFLKTFFGVGSREF